MPCEVDEVKASEDRRMTMLEECREATSPVRSSAVLEGPIEMLGLEAPAELKATELAEVALFDTLTNPWNLCSLKAV